MADIPDVLRFGDGFEREWGGSDGVFLPSHPPPPLEIVCVVGFGFSVSSVEGGVNCKTD